MKSIRLLALSLVTTLIASAQTNTYPFPASGNVGIGTTTPDAPLTVNTGAYLLRTAGTTTDIELNGFTGGGGWARAFRVGKDGSATHRYGAFGTLGSEAGVAYAYIAVPSAGEDGTGYSAFAKLVLTPIGNVGIGTVTPLKKLQIQGTAGNGSTNVQEDILFIGGNELGGIGGYSGIQVGGYHDGRYGNFIRTVKTAGYGSYWNTALTLSVTRTQTENVVDEVVRVTSDGNVGIGTTNPAAKLTIVGGPADPLQLKDSSGHSFRIGPSVGILGGFQFYDDVAAAVRIRIADSGNVGIGETNPTHKLAVNGTIKAKEVIVETIGWSDYVFADDYALQPLAEVEAHIKINKHLPGIPSAAEVATQGVSLGDMQAKLLAKIEELTLHQIAQEKELASLRQEVRSLRESAAK